VIVLLLAISHIRASFSDPGEMEHVYSLCDFTAGICQIHIGPVGNLSSDGKLV